MIPDTRQLPGNASENLSFATSHCVCGVRARDGFERPLWWTISSESEQVVTFGQDHSKPCALITML